MRQIGPYQIIDLLGKGGMGEVYLAEDIRLGRKVALKLLPPELTSDEPRVLRFQQEARTASALNHPNILTIFDIGEVESTHFIATEFVKGETLRESMSAARMNIQKVLNIITQVASALGAAHEVGVVHRDIKPENIMVRPDGLVKVLDFGIAKLTQRIATGGRSEMGLLPLVNTEPGMMIGTPKYMSPEQVRGLDVDERTDIFSLGVVLYEMLTGTAPFERATIGDTIAAILQNEPPPIAQHTTAVSTGLQQIVVKALLKDRDERYQAMSDLVSDLRSLGQEVDSNQQYIRPTQSRDTPIVAAATELATNAPREDLRAGNSEIRAGRTASSAEYIVSEIRHHKGGWALFVALLLAAVAVVVYFASRGAAISSVAVLPFVNASNDPEMEYLSDGVSESLINSLSRLPQLKVISRNSSFKYKGKDVDLQEVAKALGVQAIVTGRVMQHGDQLQVSAELADMRDKTQMWGEQYTRRAPDLLAVQSEISEQIAEKLRLRLTSAEQQQLAKDKQANPQAYDLLIKGNFHQAKFSEEDIKKAIEYFNQALAIDPNYALAHARLAGAYLDLGLNSYLDPKEAFPLAEAAAKKALDLDESLANAHVVWGRIKLLVWDWAGAERESKRALDLDPNLAVAHTLYSFYLSCQGRHDQAIAEAKRAGDLDPLVLIRTANIGYAFYFARQYDQAIEQLNKVLELDPNFSYANDLLGYVYTAKGMYPEAIAEYKKSLRLRGDETTQCYLGYALAQAGQRREADAILKQLQTAKEYVSPGAFAVLYAGLGEKEQTLESLERAYAVNDPQMQFLKVDPDYDFLRSDARFTALMRKVGLTP